MSESNGRRSSPWVVAALIATVIVVVQALLVPLFAGPAAHLAPRDLPIVVAGPAPAATALADRLAAAVPGGFEITTVPDGVVADEALRRREAYAAFVVGPDGVSLHTASAASPTVAALLSGAAQQLGGPVRVVDVVPTDADDPRGAGFAAGFLPLALTAILAGVAFALALGQGVPTGAARGAAGVVGVRGASGVPGAAASGAAGDLAGPGRLAVLGGLGRGPRIVGLVAFGVLAGLVGTAVLKYWLGILPGGYLADAGAVGLLAFALSATMTGLAAALGRAGLALGAVLVFLVGNPLSAVAAAPELLPQPWGVVGQWLPIGAGATLLRHVAYFDGARTAFPIAVLAGWALVGIVLTAVGRRRI